VRALAIALLLLAGCGEDAPGPMSRPGRGIPSRPDLPPPIDEPAPRARSPRRAATSALPPVEPVEPAVEVRPPPEADPAQELPQALQRAFGTPAACISEPTRARLGSELRVHVTVVATGSGRVTRASVTSPALAEEDLDCLRRHAESLRLPGPIPGAPRSIATAIVYDVGRAAAEPASSP